MLNPGCNELQSRSILFSHCFIMHISAFLQSVFLTFKINFKHKHKHCNLEMNLFVVFRHFVLRFFLNITLSNNQWNNRLTAFFDTRFKLQNGLQFLKNRVAKMENFFVSGGLMVHFARKLFSPWMQSSNQSHNTHYRQNE